MAEKRGQVSVANVIKDNKLLDEVLKYKEQALIFSEFCTPQRINGLTATVALEDDDDDMAISVPEYSDIPKTYHTREKIPIKLNKNVTNYFISIESEKEDAFGDLYLREAEASGKKLARKKNYDIANVIEAGAATAENAITPGTLDILDITLAQAKMRATGREPTHIFINQAKYADIQQWVINNTLLAENTLKEGWGPRLLGMLVITSNLISENCAILVDQPEKPVRDYNDGMGIQQDPYKEPGIGRGLVMYEFDNPMNVKRKASYKITNC